MTVVRRLFTGPMPKLARRTLIVIFVANLAVIAWELVFGPRFFTPLIVAPLLHPIFSTGLMVLPILILARFYFATSALAFKQHHVLDEYQRALKDRATQIYYRFLARTVLVLFVLFLLLSYSVPYNPNPLFRFWGLGGLWTPFGILFGMFTALVIMLPTVVIDFLQKSLFGY